MHSQRNIKFSNSFSQFIMNFQWCSQILRYFLNKKKTNNVQCSKLSVTKKNTIEKIIVKKIICFKSLFKIWCRSLNLLLHIEDMLLHSHHQWLYVKNEFWNFHRFLYVLRPPESEKTIFDKKNIFYSKNNC